MSEPPASKSPTPRRALGPVEGASIVVGTVIGSGIFVTPAAIAGSLGSYGFGTILLVWIVAGLLSLAGALAYAELAAMFPRSGGQYVYLKEAYGPLWAFLFGWMEFWVARPGSIAALAVAFTDYLGEFVALGPDQQRWAAFAAVAAFTLINYVGVKTGGVTQVLFTAVKVGALVALVIGAFVYPIGTPQNWQPFFSGSFGWALLPAFGWAMLQSLWAFDGWANGAAVSEEVRDPQRNVPRALLFGTLAITGIYLAVNLAYHYVVPMAEVASSKRVAATVAGTLLGPPGASLIAAAVMISTAGAVNGLLLTGPRIFYAMARDQLFFRQMGELHLRFRTPHWSILFQGAWAGLLILIPFGDFLNPLLGWEKDKKLFDQLITFVIFASWAFYGMTVAGVLVLRVRRPELERPYRAWGYPAVPLAFVLLSIAFVGYTLWTQPQEALAGLFLVLLGLPAYWFWHPARHHRHGPEPPRGAAR
ncbi:MAG: APC family permease [Armatimonadota bacterium]